MYFLPSFPFFLSFRLRWSHYVALADLEFTVRTLMALTLKRSICLCPSASRFPSGLAHFIFKNLPF